MFESTLWIALRIMEERRNLLMKMEADHTKKGFSQLAKIIKKKRMISRYMLDKMKEFYMLLTPQLDHNLITHN